MHDAMDAAVAVFQQEQAAPPARAPAKRGGGAAGPRKPSTRKRVPTQKAVAEEAAAMPVVPGGDAQAVASQLPGTKAVSQSTNKPLSSRFRGVCWNKKNKRWQAAINSSGK